MVLFLVFEQTACLGSSFGRAAGEKSASVFFLLSGCTQSPFNPPSQKVTKALTLHPFYAL